MLEKTLLFLSPGKEVTELAALLSSQLVTARSSPSLFICLCGKSPIGNLAMGSCQYPDASLQLRRPSIPAHPRYRGGTEQFYSAQLLLLSLLCLEQTYGWAEEGTLTELWALPLAGGKGFQEERSPGDHGQEGMDVLRYTTQSNAKGETLN